MTQFFSHIVNVASVDDCISLFFHVTKLTISFVIQLSISAFRNILNFNPRNYNYHIPNINTQLNQLLFLLPLSHASFIQKNDYITSSPPTPVLVSLSPEHNGSETRLMMLKMVDLPNSNTD